MCCAIGICWCGDWENVLEGNRKKAVLPKTTAALPTLSTMKILLWATLLFYQLQCMLESKFYNPPKYSSFFWCTSSLHHLSTSLPQSTKKRSSTQFFTQKCSFCWRLIEATDWGSDIIWALCVWRVGVVDKSRCVQWIHHFGYCAQTTALCTVDTSLGTLGIVGSSWRIQKRKWIPKHCCTKNTPFPRVIVHLIIILTHIKVGGDSVGQK